MTVAEVSIEDVKEVLQIIGVLGGLAAYFADVLINNEKIKELEKYIIYEADIEI